MRWNLQLHEQTQFHFTHKTQKLMKLVERIWPESICFTYELNGEFVNVRAEG